MLTLTENANTIAATIVAQQSTTPDAGLRIHSSGTEAEPRFAVTVAPTPEPGDEEHPWPVVGPALGRTRCQRRACSRLGGSTDGRPSTRR